MVYLFSPEVRWKLKSVYPAAIGNQAEIVDAFCYASRLPHVTTPGDLVKAVRIHLRNRLCLATTEAERRTCKHSMLLLNSFTLSGHAYAERVLRLLGEAGEGQH